MQVYKVYLTFALQVTNQMKPLLLLALLVPFIAVAQNFPQTKKHRKKLPNTAKHLLTIIHGWKICVAWM
jgi:hypothetical protein